ncbi:MAG: TlpA disulfide reductase family protein, partial [bacterium]
MLSGNVSRRMIREGVLIAGLFFGSLMLTGNGIAGQNGDDKGLNVAVGDTLSPFMLRLYGGQGEYVALRDYCGEPRKPWNAPPRRPVVISFFANWCQPCRKEIPELEKVSKTWGENVSVFLVSVGDKPEQIAGFLEEVPTGLPVLMDPYKTTSTERYGVSGLPTV